uniref:RNA helicase n=1 Tax=Oryza glumipatula TaxID=40148 RepID=A0A0D9YVF4_9ORYZ
MSAASSSGAGGALINDVLTDDVLRAVLARLVPEAERDAFGLVCRRWLRIQSSDRRRLRARAGPAMLRRLAARFPGILELDLSQSPSRSFYPGVIDDDLDVVAGGFRNLRVLALQNCKGVTDVGMAKIGDRLPSLQSIDVSHCRKLSDKGLKAVLLGCQNLRQLVIAGCRLITDNLLIALSKSCIHLEDLVAAGCNNITDAGISGLADGCHKMKSLDMSKCNKVGDPGVCRFAEVSSSSLVSLKLLDCNKVGDKSIHALAKFCHNLETLVIGGCRDVTDASIEALAFACCSRLKCLRMDWCLKITDSSLRSLLSNCKLLVAIDVGCCDQITDAAFQDMDANGFQSALRLLKISSCVRITVAGVRNVIESCMALEHLDVRSCPQVTRQSCEQAGLQFPGSCKEIWRYLKPKPSQQLLNVELVIWVNLLPPQTRVYSRTRTKSIPSGICDISWKEGYLAVVKLVLINRAQMRLTVGQVHRHVLALASSRLCFVLGDHLPFRMLSLPRVVRFHQTAWHDIQTVEDKSGPLTLASLEVQNKVEYVKKERATRTGGTKPSSRASALNMKPKVSSFNAKPVKSALPKSAVLKKTLKIDESLFSAKSFEELGPLKRPTEQDSSDKRSGVEAVIVAPSRELGMQIVREVEKILGPNDKRLVQQLVGGSNRSRQEEALKKNKPIIVVGTPGRISEISAAGKLHTHSCLFLVLDEVDQLLSFNYREDMHRILEHVGRKSGTSSRDILGPLARRSERQTILVSATIPFSVIRAARSWGHDPVLVRAMSVVPLESITVPRPVLSQTDANSNSPSNSVNQAAVDSLPPSLEHYYCTSKAQHKVDTLRRCIHALEAQTVIEFMNNTKPLKDVVFKLEARGMKATELHGDLGKLARSTVLKKFKDGEFRVLVTNELSARGLDVPECDLVINLDLPTDSTHYAHRAGRTGRLGRKGTVVTICEETETFVVRKMRKQLAVPIKPCEFTEGKLLVHKEEDVE